MKRLGGRAGAPASTTRRDLLGRARLAVSMRSIRTSPLIDWCILRLWPERARRSSTAPRTASRPEAGCSTPSIPISGISHSRCRMAKGGITAVGGWVPPANMWHIGMWDEAVSANAGAATPGNFGDSTDTISRMTEMRHPARTQRGSGSGPPLQQRHALRLHDCCHLAGFATAEGQCQARTASRSLPAPATMNTRNGTFTNFIAYAAPEG